MRFSNKLFLCVMFVLALALGIAEYYTVSSNFDVSLERQTNAAIEKHQSVQYAIQASMLTASNSRKLDVNTIYEIAAQTQEDLGTHLTVTITDSEDNNIYYKYIKNGDVTQLVVTSSFTQSGYNVSLVTNSDISFVYLDAAVLRENCQRIFLIVIVGCAFLTFILSRALTRPIDALNKTSHAFAAGDYNARLEAVSTDEIGELTIAYNEMADSIQEKINALELAIIQREDFNASFAHELKTPMTSIIGYADMLNQKELPPEKVQELSGYILNEGLRLEALSFKLLELVTLSRNDFVLEQMPTVPVFEDLQQTIQATADKRGVDLMVKAEPAYISIEYDLFKTLLLNLADNALKSGASLVSIIAGKAEDGLYEILISDNGRGIPEEELKRITEAFYMVDKMRSRKEHGAGLGLALCEKIAQIHHCKLEFTSEENIGTSVKMRMEATYEEDC